ncbi:MAG TPA: nickel pincer cofactor biosynthesis protein LarC [Candidatus Binataceae bacterium]|nr:nickel pincer cofactor biosynthesis protein LarC [Candidatus Binataceae bacterium]
MKTAYLDTFSGLSGDMMVGALLDCGADFDEFTAALSALPIEGYGLASGRSIRSGISALKFEVTVTTPQPERHFSEIRALIESAKLAAGVTSRAIAVFEALADAEAKVHRTTRDQVHFHEVGAVDSIIDIVGSAWLLERLEIGAMLVGELPMGRGFVRSRHGTIPIPAPATIELLTGFPVKMNDGNAEMVTPTGAAIMRALARPAPDGLIFDAERVGYGAGSRELSDRPNLLRVLIGSEQIAYQSDTMVAIEANIDDLNPQVYGYLTDRLMAAGARDVTLTPTIMKKGRPGVIVTVLAEPARKEALAAILFAETSTIGLRFHPVSRLKLHREIYEVTTRFGPIRVKVSGSADSAALTIAPEYEDCRRAAESHQVALRVVIEEVQAAARHLHLAG